MKNYRVMLNGENLLLDLGEGLGKYGFFTTLFISAPNKEEAEFRAVESLRKRDVIKNILKNEQSDPPMLYAEEIEEIQNIQEEKLELGFSWYRENKD